MTRLEAIEKKLEVGTQSFSAQDVAFLLNYIRVEQKLNQKVKGQ